MSIFKDLYEETRGFRLTYKIKTIINPREWILLYRWRKQRADRGWSDRDWWSMDYFLKDIIPPMLRKYAKEGGGIPTSLDKSYTDKQFQAAIDKWHKDLLKAADDIEAYYKHEELPFPKSRAARDKYFANSRVAEKRTKDGMKFVANNFLSLWD